MELHCNADNIVTCQLHLKWIKMAKWMLTRDRAEEIQKAKFINNFVCKFKRKATKNEKQNKKMAEGAHWMLIFIYTNSATHSSLEAKQISFIYAVDAIKCEFV